VESSKGGKVIAKVKVGKPSDTPDTDQIVLPVAIPEFEEIRQLAIVLHERGKPYQDTVWGWPVRYSPMRPEPVPDSNMNFTPADMFIGVWPIWWVSIMWEDGNDQAPNVTVGDEELIK